MANAPTCQRHYDSWLLSRQTAITSQPLTAAPPPRHLYNRNCDGLRPTRDQYDTNTIQCPKPPVRLSTFSVKLSNFELSGFLKQYYNTNNCYKRNVFFYVIRSLNSFSEVVYRGIWGEERVCIAYETVRWSCSLERVITSQQTMVTESSFHPDNICYILPVFEPAIPRVCLVCSCVI